MKYYITHEGGKPHETTKEHYYSIRRRKDAREKVWISGGQKVAKEVIIK